MEKYGFVFLGCGRDDEEAVASEGKLNQILYATGRKQRRVAKIWLYCGHLKQQNFQKKKMLTEKLKATNYKLEH